MKFTISMFYDAFLERGYQVNQLSIENDDEIHTVRINRSPPTVSGMLHIFEISESEAGFSSQHDFFSVQGIHLDTAMDIIDETFEFYRSWENELLYAILKNEDFQSLVDIAERVFQNPMYIANWQGKVLGYTHQFADATFRPFWKEMVETGLLPISCIRELRESENYNAVLLKNQAILFTFHNYDYRCILGMITNEQEILFNFQIVEYATKLTPAKVRLANVFLSLLQHIRTEQRSDYALTASLLFTDLLEGKKIDADRLSWTLASLGWEQKKTPFYCILFKPNQELPSKLYLNGQLEHRIPRGKVIYWNEEILVLINQTDFEQLENDIHYLAVNLNVTCGISLPFSDWYQLQNAYNQAALALYYAASGSTFSYCQQHIWKYTISELAKHTRSINLIHPALNKLKEYDLKNDTELLKTLYIFLRNERNSTLTAKQLFIHRNTLQYRLHKINELLELDLDDSDIRLNLIVSYILMDYN